MAHELQSASSVTTVELASDDFASLLQREFRPTSPERGVRIEQAVQTLAQQALIDTDVVSDDVFETIDGLIGALDRKLSEQINEIIHNESFQQLESAWRGLAYLVDNTATGTDLKIKVMNVSKAEVGSMLRQYKGTAWDQSPLFKKIYEDEFGKLGGNPFGAFVCDYYFDHSTADLDIMKGLTKIGAAAHAPIISAAAPSILGMESWQELANPRDLAKQFEAVEYAGWRSFRETNDSRYLALTMPRVLGRPLYGEQGEPVEGFQFEEDTDGGAHDKHLWINAGYGLATRITDAFREYGWCTRIRGVQAGGTLEDLPVAIFPTDDGGTDQKCPTEIAISDRRDGELSASGFMALIHRKNTDQATFIGAQTVHKAAVYQDPGATQNANLAARLPYLFASCRFAHYLKCMVRDWVGRARDAESLERELRTWVMQYVDGQPENSSEATQARKPLKGADISITPDEENPGYYKGVFRFLPHYQFEGMDVSLSMVSRLPKGRN
jgi:type VI secretion system protein ImpC